MTAPKKTVHLTVRDLAVRFQVTPHTIYNWRRDGILPEPVIEALRVVRWREVDIEKWELERVRATA